MTGPVLLDLVILVAILVRAWVGAHDGLLASTLSLIGMVAGGAAGLWAGPQLIALVPQLDATRLLRSITLVAVFGCAVFLGELLLHNVGRRIRGSDHAKGADAVLGCVAAAVVVSLVSWTLLTSTRSIAPPQLGRSIDESIVYQLLDSAVPDQFNELPLRAVDIIGSQLPDVFGGLEPELPIPEPDSDSLGTPQVQQAAESIVKIRTDAPSCRADSAGTGWVVAAQRVVTNAHVVAGSSEVVVSVTGRGPDLAASVVAFDPDLDLAILAVPELAAPALARAEPLASGADAVAAGFPWGGPYVTAGARIRGTVVENGSDIYGAVGVPREVYAIRGVVRPGNSGGPLLTPDGRVAGTVFAMSKVDAETGYVLTDAATAPLLDAAAGLTEPVPTGGCAVG